MEGKLQCRKPENWQDFERLCKKLWGEIWDCPNTIKRNGRQGQAQKGVDVYGIPKDETAYWGIQCKGKDDYTKSQLSEDEIENEIAKAQTFEPPLHSFYFATTANKDAKIEEYIRKKNIESIKAGGFIIDVYAWEDIVDLIEANRDTYNWYLNNCQYNDSSNIDVFVNWKKEYEIHPQYIRTTKIYHKKPDLDLYRIPSLLLLDQLDSSFKFGINLPNIINPRCKVDYRWCTIPINIKNIGATVIEDYKLELMFEPDKISDIDDKFHHLNNWHMNPAVVAQINASKDAKREVFESSEYSNVIEYRPLKSILVQTDYRTFQIGIKPKDKIDQFELKWIVKSRNYSKKGTLHIKVTPEYENKKTYIEVETANELKETEIIIEPKIVEE